MSRYTVNFLNRPAGGHVSGATLFFANNDVDAAAVLAAIELFTDGNVSRMNKTVDFEAQTSYNLSGTCDIHVHYKFADGSLANMFIPVVPVGITDTQIKNAFFDLPGGAAPLQNAAGSPIASIVKTEKINYRN